MTDWEPERLTRLKRERKGLVEKRDVLAADLADYDSEIQRYDGRIKEEEARMNGEAKEAV